MTEGTSQGLFVVVAIVIFGIFIGLTYTLFGSEGLSNDLENLFGTSIEQANESLVRKEPLLLYSENREVNFNTSNYNKYIGFEEFVQHDLDLSPYVDENGAGNYTLVFDLKVSKTGKVAVYTMNGQSYKYSWGSKTIQATTEYQTFSLDLDIQKSEDFPDAVRSMLAFWGGGSYASDILPSVKNVKLYKVVE